MKKMENTTRQQPTNSEEKITAKDLGAVTVDDSKSEDAPTATESQEDVSDELTEGEEGEDEEEETPEKAAENQQSMVEKLTSPEALIMVPVALTLDSIGIILILVALDDFGITDIVGICTIGAWTFFRSKGQEMKVTGSAKEKTEKAVAKIGEKVKKLEQKFPKATKWAKRLKWLKPLSMGLEFIPYVGAAPLWTICVFLTLIHDNEG